jgi:hypothetical protein
MDSAMKPNPPQRTGTDFDTHLQVIGARVLRSLQGFLALIISISIFGASLFGVLVSQLQPPGRWTDGTVRMLMAVSWLLFVLALAVAAFSAVLIGPPFTDDSVGPAALGAGGAAFDNLTEPVHHFHHSHVHNAPDNSDAARPDNPAEKPGHDPAPQRGYPTLPGMASRPLELQITRRHAITAIIVNFSTEVLVVGAFLFMSLAVVPYAEPVGWCGVGFSAAAGIMIVIIWINKLSRWERA